jgi:arylsulfatase A-like enzyme
MIARWPSHIPAGTVCDELVQNIDWVPTCFDLAGAKRPENYTLHGRSLAPLLATGKADAWRDHLYFEMGHARAVSTKDFSYIAVRYPQEVIAEIQRATPDRLPRLMTYMGRLGFAVRGAENPGFWDADQLYDLRRDPGETKNLAADPQYAAQLATMRELLTADIKAVGRPFGELLPGGNAAPPGQVDAQIARVKTLEVEGKTVRDPETDEAAPRKKMNRKKASRD